MARILTGIQSTGVPHLGNILGAILPAIELSKTNSDSFFFIANMHTLTAIKDSEKVKEFTYSAAATWIALGLDYKAATFYRQSDIPEVTELTWYLNCFTPYGLLKKAHAFKDKSANTKDVNVGLFDYPVLMAADILLYDAEQVPVGKDQKQHIEITRDICNAFNHTYSANLLTEPVEIIREDVQLIPGLDGEKMSKSRNNTIDIFASDQSLKKTVMSIQTDSKTLEEPKNPDDCLVYTLYAHLANEEQKQQMRQHYIQGGYGYGQAKKALLELIHQKFDPARQRYSELMADTSQIEEILAHGAQKARKVARTTLSRVRNSLGYV